MSTLLSGGAPSVIVFRVVGEFSPACPPRAPLPPAATVPPAPRVPPAPLPPLPVCTPLGVEPHASVAAQSAGIPSIAALLPVDIRGYLRLFHRRPHPLAAEVGI